MEGDASLVDIYGRPADMQLKIENLKITGTSAVEQTS
jgi:hypothetical protein